MDAVVALKDVKLQNMIAEGRLKLRKGAVQFLDECLLEVGLYSLETQLPLSSLSMPYIWQQKVFVVKQHTLSLKTPGFNL